MSKFKAAVFVGSLRKDSMNLKLAKAITKLGASRFDAHFVQYGDLPLFSQDLEASVPAPVTRLKGEVESADAVLFVTPEYNRGMPGPLKNAIDWASRPYGKNSFAKKPGGLAGCSPGAIGAAVSQNSLKPVFNYLEIALMGAPELYFQFKEGLIDADGNVTSEDTKKFLQGWADKYASWVEQHLSQVAAQKRAAG